MLSFSIAPERYALFAGENLQSLAGLLMSKRLGSFTEYLSRRMSEDILKARGTDEPVVDKNILNNFRDKDFY